MPLQVFDLSYCQVRCNEALRIITSGRVLSALVDRKAVHLASFLLIWQLMAQDHLVLCVQLIQVAGTRPAVAAVLKSLVCKFRHSPTGQISRAQGPTEDKSH